MKRSIINLAGLSVIMLLAFSGCDKVKNLLDVTFTTTSTEVTFTVNPSAAGEYSSEQEVIQSDLNRQIAENGGRVSELKSVEIEECTINVVTPGRNLNPFQSFEVYAEVSGQAEKKIASADSIPDNVTSVPLILAADDIKSLIDKDQYKVTLKGVLDSALLTPIDLKAIIKYKVVVGPK